MAMYFERLPQKDVESELYMRLLCTVEFVQSTIAW